MTPATRQQHRRAQFAAAIIAAGWLSDSEFVTAVINALVQVPAPTKDTLQRREEKYKSIKEVIMYPHTMTVARNDYQTEAEYRKAYRDAIEHYGHNKVKVDDGKGGTGWMFFESAEDMRIWKQQK